MTQRALTCVVTLVTSAPAWATGKEGAGSPFAGDIGNAFWTLLIFVLVVLILGKFAWGPILGVLQKREDFIRDSLERAQEDREQAEARLREYEKKLAEAKLVAATIMDEGRREGETLKRKIEEDARKEASAMIERAKREIGIATDTAIRDLYDLSGQLATDIASRMIRKEVDMQEHERLIAESIDEFSQSEHRSRWQR